VGFCGRFSEGVVLVERAEVEMGEGVGLGVGVGRWG
jgi:hypothetical protein